MNEEEFLKAFDQWYEPLRNFCYYRTGDAAQAGDIVQDAFIKLWEKRSGVRGATVKSLLYTIASNLMKNMADHGRVVINFSTNFRLNESPPTPEFELELKEFNEKLQKAINRLDAKNREVFLMNRIDQYTYVEIAAILGLSVKAIEKRMKKALDELKREIEYKI